MSRQGSAAALPSLPHMASFSRMSLTLSESSTLNSCSCWGPSLGSTPFSSSDLSSEDSWPRKKRLAEKAALMTGLLARILQERSGALLGMKKKERKEACADTPGCRSHLLHGLRLVQTDRQTKPLQLAVKVLTGQVP